MNVIIFSRYGSLGSSSRVRFFQYIPWMEKQGVKMTISPLFSDLYLKRLYKGRRAIREIAMCYVARIFSIVEVRQYDLVILEKELLPFFPPIFEWLMSKMKVPILVDYDDATFHRYDTHPNFLIRIFLKGKIDSVMRAASIVTAGNQYLSKRAQRAGANHVFTIPTVVDLRYYQPAVASRDNEQLIVGWIGTPMTSHYLEPLIPSFVRLSMRFNVRFVAVGANAIDFKNTPIETWGWHLETEVECIRQFDVGIMPLSNNTWERGKCGYKLIQYMGCAIPVVASPVGVNSTIVKPGINGFLAHDKEWDCMLTKLLSDSELRKTLGRNARKDVEECYSTQVQAPRLLQAMKQSIYIKKP